MGKIANSKPAKGKPRQRSSKVAFRPDLRHYFVADSSKEARAAAVKAYPQTKAESWLIADSIPEYHRFEYLIEKFKAGEITNLSFHPKFELIPPVRLPKNRIRRDDIKQRAMTYTADASYYWKGLYIVEDVKAPYSNTPKNKQKKRAGKPILNESAGDKHKALNAALLAIHGADFVFRLVTMARQELHMEEL